MTSLMVMALFGLIVGSFANVCIQRIPRGASIVSPGSACPHCRQPISWYDNIPLLSWLLLRGRCRECKANIPVRYPLIELAMALSWALCAWHFGIQLQLVAPLTLVSLLWMLAAIDLETGLLPDKLTLTGMLMGMAFNVLWGDPWDSVLGAALGYGSLWAVAKGFYLLTSEHGMGYGDFKLAAMLGAFLHWQALPFIILIASVLGILIGGGLLLLRGRGVRTPIPFGPFLALGGAAWLFFGDEIPWLFWRMIA